MDALLPAPEPPAAALGLAEELARRVSRFIQAGGRAVIFVDPAAPARAAALGSVLAALPAGAVRIGNPLASALTLHRLMFQLGIEDEGEDAGGLIVCALDAPFGGRMAMLAVDDAHSLTPDAMAALAHVPCPASADQAGRLLLLAGGPGLLGLVSGPGCEVLRDPRLTLTIVAPVFAEVASAGSFEESGAAGPPRSRTATGRRWWTVPLLAGSFLVGLVGTLVLFWTSRPPLPPGAPTAALAPVAAVPPRPNAAAVAGVRTSPETPPDTPEPGLPPTPQPTLALAGAQLRREFDAFLNRAGHDTAGLSAKARNRLFREYLKWRTRNGERPEVP